MRLRILRDHDHRIAPARTLAFKAGSDVNVPRAIARALIAAGAAQPLREGDTETPAAKD